MDTAIQISVRAVHERHCIWCNTTGGKCLSHLVCVIAALLFEYKDLKDHGSILTDMMSNKLFKSHTCDQLTEIKDKVHSGWTKFNNDKNIELGKVLTNLIKMINKYDTENAINDIYYSATILLYSILELAGLQ